MRVLIDMSFADRGPSGTATYLRGLTAALAELDDVEVVEARQPGRPGPGRSGGDSSVARSLRNLALDVAWLRFGLTAAAARTGADLIHHPLPAHSLGWRGKQVVTVQDLAFERLPGLFDPWWRRVARRRYAVASRQADAVVCISEGTARDVRSRWGVPPGRIVVAHPAVSGPDAPAREPRNGGYALYVGDAEPRKNLATLVSAWRLYRQDAAAADRPPLELVLAGRRLESALDGEHPDGLRIVDSPAQTELDGLLAGASALVHPSLHEGFGLTMLEAMSRGLPVLCARAAGSAEICGDAALYFDPASPAELALRLGEVASDPQLLSRLSTRGRARAEELSWQESARLHREAYRLALGSSEA
jgi:glycosyltransferase involved in cell wall biosynthesis